jgi:hypothetical protein
MGVEEQPATTESERDARVPGPNGIGRWFRALSTSDKIASISFILSALAFFVSIRSCDVSQQAHELSHRTYLEERQLVLTGDFSKDGNEVKIRSIEPPNVFLEGTATFPEAVCKEQLPITSASKTLYLFDPKMGLQKLIEARVPNEKGLVKVSTNGKIPVLIDSYYTSKGESYTDRSIYLLSVDVLVPERGPAKVTLTSITFFRRFPPNTFLRRDYLDELLKGKGYDIPPKGPR